MTEQGMGAQCTEYGLTLDVDDLLTYAEIGLRSQAQGSKMRMRSITRMINV